MNIVICGNILPLELEKRLLSASLAGGKYLRNMKKAFEDNGFNVKSIMHVALPGAEKAFGNYRGDLNQKYILKDRLIVPSVIQYHKCLQEITEPSDVAIFYNINYAQWGQIKELKKKGVKCCLILADHSIPADYSNIVRRKMALLDEKEYLEFDYAVLLSKYAARYVKKTCRYEIIEGGLDMSAYDGICPLPMHKSDSVVRFLYAGTLEPVTGIDRCLEAFSKVKNKNCKLTVCGKGSLISLIQDAADTDKRIDFRGYVSDEEYIDLLNESDVLINPRNMDMNENKNNFPSKVLEYLASGRKTISSKFPGWERFSDNFIFYENGIDELSALLEKEATGIGDFNEYYKLNRKEAEEYDWHNQVKRICNMVGI